MATKKLDPVTPGEILKLEFLDEMGVTPYALAKAISVPPNRVTAIVNGERAITADTALRFSIFFGTSPEFWMNLQSRYDLLRAMGELPTIEQEVKKYVAA